MINGWNRLKLLIGLPFIMLIGLIMGLVITYCVWMDEYILASRKSKENI